MSLSLSFNGSGGKPPLLHRLNSMVAAARAGRLEELEKLFQTYRLEPTYSENAALKAAIKAGHPGCVEFLIQQGALSDEHQNTKLVMYAVREGTAEICALVHDSLLRQRQWDLTPIMICKAAELGKERTCQLLLERKSFSYQALAYRAASGGYIGVLQWLKDQKYDFDQARGAALNVAIYYDRREVVDYLLQIGADPDAGQGRLLLEAIKEHQTDYALKLIDAGADPGLNTGQPLIEAARAGDLKVAARCLEKGVDVNTKNGDALGWAVVNENKDMVRLLLKNGADPRLENSYAFTRSAANTEILKLILDQPFELDLHADNGMAAVEAIKNKNPEALKLLFQSGFDANRYQRRLASLAYSKNMPALLKVLNSYCTKYRYRYKVPERGTCVEKNAAVIAARHNTYPAFLAQNGARVSDLKKFDSFGNSVLEILAAHGRFTDIMSPALWRGQEGALLELLERDLRHLGFKDKAKTLGHFKAALHLQRVTQQNPKAAPFLKRRPK